MKSAILALIVLAAGALQGCAHTPPANPADPLETVNRGIFTFNNTADKYVMRPIAHGYVDVVPAFAREGVTNFFANLTYPKVIINDLLQAKFLQSGKDLTRFIANSVFGLGGLLDVSTRAGLPAHDEDSGQTLGYWGIGPGWFLMLPFFGPADNRDAIGRVADMFMDPLTYVPGHYDLPHYSLVALQLVDIRANLLGTESLLEAQFDPYIFVRTAYLQHRRSLVYDGNPPQLDIFALEPAPDDDAAPAETPVSPSSPKR